MMIFLLYIFTVFCSKFYPELLKTTTEQSNNLIEEEGLPGKLWVYDYDCNRKNIIADLETLILWNNRIKFFMDEFEKKISELNSTFKVLVEFTATPELKDSLIKCHEIIKKYKKIFKDKESWLDTKLLIFVGADLDNRSYDYTTKKIQNIKKYFEEFKKVVTKLLAYHENILKMHKLTPSHYKLVYKNIEELCQFSWAVTPTDLTANALINCAEVIKRLNLK